MKQEDKAKAYDKVRKKIAIRFGSNVADEFFAEFEESEDEKVRKALLELVHDTTGDELWIDYNVHKEEALDWLERQGEHANFRNKIQVGDKVTRNENGALVNLTQLKRVAKPSEKQCEQKLEIKTAEESLGIDSDTYNKIVDECIFGEQKPEENKGNIGGISPNWSDDDERMLDYVIGDILSADTLIGGKETASYKCDWLKSLKGRVQHQQEWSKEDEACVILLDSICESSEAEYYDHPDSIIRKEIVNARNWLKFLKGRVKPQWKPSDEQIKVCKEVYADILSAKGFDLGTVNSELNRLEEDLKKLKEK